MSDDGLLGNVLGRVAGDIIFTDQTTGKTKWGCYFIFLISAFAIILWLIWPSDNKSVWILEETDMHYIKEITINGTVVFPNELSDRMENIIKKGNGKNYKYNGTAGFTIRTGDRLHVITNKSVTDDSIDGYWFRTVIINVDENKVTFIQK